MLQAKHKKKLDDLLSVCHKNLRTVNDDLITRAFEMSLEAHKYDLRSSGEPYFGHPYEVAMVLAKEIALDDISVASALLHESYRNLEDVLNKANLYSSAGATKLHLARKKASLRTALGHGLWAFFRTYFFRFGFLDGRLGFVLAVSVAEETYYRYLKLWLLSRNSTTPESMQD